MTGAQTYSMNFGIVPEDMAQIYAVVSIRPSIGLPTYWARRSFSYMFQNQQNTNCFMEVYVGTYRRDHYTGGAPASGFDLTWRDENEMIALGNWQQGGSSISSPGVGQPEAATPFENKLLVTMFKLKKIRSFSFRPGETKRLNFNQKSVFVDNGYVGYQSLALDGPLQAIRGRTKCLIVKVWGEPGYEISTTTQANLAKINSTRAMFAYQCLKEYTVYWQQTPSTALPREVVNNLTTSFTTFGSMTENTPQVLPTLI